MSAGLRRHTIKSGEVVQPFSTGLPWDPGLPTCMIAHGRSCCFGAVSGVCDAVFYEFRLYDVWLSDSKYFPRWRQQTGSGLPSRFLVCPRAKINRATLRQGPSIEKTRPPHRKPSWKTTSGLRPPPWKTAETDVWRGRQSRGSEHENRGVSIQTNSTYRPVKAATARSRVARDERRKKARNPLLIIITNP